MTPHSFKDSRLIHELVLAQRGDRTPPLSDFKSLFYPMDYRHQQIIIRLLSTGNHESRKHVAMVVAGHVRYPPKELGHRVVVEHSIELWHVFDIADELGLNMKNKEIYSDTNVRITPSDYDTLSDAYWRGKIALNLVTTRHPLFYDNKDAQKEFVIPAGSHPDVCFVIRTALERETLDMNTINHIYTGSENVSVMREGVL